MILPRYTVIIELTIHTSLASTPYSYTLIVILVCRRAVLVQQHCCFSTPQLVVVPYLRTLATIAETPYTIVIFGTDFLFSPCTNHCDSVLAPVIDVRVQLALTRAVRAKA